MFGQRQNGPPPGHPPSQIKSGDAKTKQPLTRRGKFRVIAGSDTKTGDGIIRP